MLYQLGTKLSVSLFILIQIVHLIMQVYIVSYL